jgi:DNA-binding LacI/PurR family transcriptional regulator
VLSTVVQPTDEKGRMAARAVVELLDGNLPPDVALPVSVRLGTTTGPPPDTVRR